MRQCLTLLVFILFAQILVAQEYSREEAIRLALHEIIVPATLDHTVMAFITRQPLLAGDRIMPFLDGKEKMINKPTWFVWINDNPEAFFSHHTRYVFIDAETGEHEIQIEDWWPTLNGENLFMSDDEWADLDLIIYSDLHRSLPER